MTSYTTFHKSAFHTRLSSCAPVTVYSTRVSASDYPSTLLDDMQGEDAAPWRNGLAKPSRHGGAAHV